MRSSIAGAVVASFVVGAQALGQEVLQEWSGGGPILLQGLRVAALGDVDGDGSGDALVAGLVSAIDPPRLEVRGSRSGALLLSIDAGNLQCGMGSAGDVDGDGADDLLLGDVDFLDVVSGLTGATLLQIPSPDTRASFLFGISVAGVGDVDGDGVPDVAGGGVLEGFGIGEGDVLVASGADGHVIHAFDGASFGENGFGWALARLPDRDGDGVDELAVGVPGGSTRAKGFVRVFSLQSGAELATIDGPTGFRQFGAALATCRDLNGDGIGELLVSAATKRPFLFFEPTEVFVLSGADFSILAQLPRPADAIAFGRELAGAGDVNGDGAGDFLVTMNTAARQTARLYDGRTLQTLYTTEADSGNPASVAGLPDVDGDGYDDFLVGRSSPAPGRATLFAGDDLFLDASPTSVAAGETLDRAIRTGVPGNLALMAVVAVNASPLFVIVDGPRALDGAGSLASSVVVPPGLSGLAIDYQGIAIDARGKLAKTASESVLFE